MVVIRKNRKSVLEEYYIQVRDRETARQAKLRTHQQPDRKSINDPQNGQFNLIKNNAEHELSSKEASQGNRMTDSGPKFNSIKPMTEKGKKSTQVIASHGQSGSGACQRNE